MDESNRWLLLFLSWCAILVGLLFCWIVWRSEIAAWCALAWVGYGTWMLLNSRSEAESERDREYQRQFYPGSATEKQLRYIQALCREHGKNLPANLEELSAFEAKGLISELTDKAVEL